MQSDKYKPFAFGENTKCGGLGLKVLITGAAGNLGSLLADYLKNDESLELNLMIHKKDVPENLKNHTRVKVFRADLSDKVSLQSALRGVDVIIHFAGILFKANPEKFLPLTNTLYFRNLADAAIENRVRRLILISFPHVEGETSKENPATGRLDGFPISVHAKTRLEEEKYLFSLNLDYAFEPVSLRVGMVYGRGILMIEGGRRFAKLGLLGIWKKPTRIHLIPKVDFLEAAKNAIVKENIEGIYHLGDDGYQTLQEFADSVCKYWGYRKPWRMPVGLIMFVAGVFEFISKIFGIVSPLTKDFIRIGMVSYYGDTTRMRQELLPELKYKTFKDGMESF